MAQLMSQTEFAARHRVGKPAVSNWKKRGLLVFAPDPDRPGKELVDVARSDLLVRGTIDPTRGRTRTAGEAAAPPSPSEPAARRELPMSGLQQAQLADIEERTRRRKIETEVMLGTLVPIAEYERRAGDLGRLIRERTQALIRQHAERVAAESDPRTIMALLGEAFDQLFNQVADEVEAEATKEREVDQVLAAEPDGEDEDLELGE